MPRKNTQTIENNSNSAENPTRIEAQVPVIVPFPENEKLNESVTQVAPPLPLNSVPPKVFKRNQYGLIGDGSIFYHYKDDGKINWRKMIKPEFLVPHKQVFNRLNKPIPDSIEGLADNELLILLGGIKDLARIRGYKEVKPTVVSAHQDFVAAYCWITWIPNYEEEMMEQTFGDGADATPYNCNGFGKNYLTSIACNRAFVRAVRNYLGINIVSQEEIGGAQNDSTEAISSNLLKETMDKFNVTFDKIKAKLIEEKIEGAENFSSINDIPRYKQFELIERIKKKAAAKSNS